MIVSATFTGRPQKFAKIGVVPAGGGKEAET
jgi:hypothetical protein